MQPSNVIRNICRGGSVALLLAALPMPSQASGPSLACLPKAVAVFQQSAAPRRASAIPPSSGAPPRGTFGTSVIPPGAPPGHYCSVNDPAGGDCSALLQDERCSAISGYGHFCSALDLQGGSSKVCSAFEARTVCSVFPRLMITQVAESFCSAANSNSTGVQLCSAVGTGTRQLCSAKGDGLDDQCSVTGLAGLAPPRRCSVLNPGAATRSFCSTRAGSPVLSRRCSTFTDAPDECSVLLGGKGVCTTFGAADPSSCSVIAPTGAHCSIIGGAPGNRCVQ